MPVAVGSPPTVRSQGIRRRHVRGAAHESRSASVEASVSRNPRAVGQDALSRGNALPTVVST